MKYRTILAFAGLLSLLIALLHIGMIIVGAQAYEYFDAGKEMVSMAQAGSIVPALITCGVTAAFTVFALYGFSGANFIKALPFLQPALWGIGVIYTLRGLGLFVQLFELYQGQTGEHLAPKDLVFSCVSLLIGIVYLLGVSLRSKSMR